MNGLSQTIAVAEYVLGTIRTRRLGLASMQNRDTVAQAQELPDDVSPNEAGCTNSKNLHGPFVVGRVLFFRPGIRRVYKARPALRFQKSGSA